MTAVEIGAALEREKPPIFVSAYGRNAISPPSVTTHTAIWPRTISMPGLRSARRCRGTKCSRARAAALSYGVGRIEGEIGPPSAEAAGRRSGRFGFRPIFKPRQKRRNCVAVENPREWSFQLKAIDARFPLLVKKHGIRVYERYQRINEIERIVRLPLVRLRLLNQRTNYRPTRRRFHPLQS
jgi:hypothetical protein